MNYDSTDIKLLAVLRRDSAKNLRYYTSQTFIPKSTVHERLRRLASQGTRFVPLIDFSAAGFSLQTVFLAKFDVKLLDEPCVNTAFHVAPNSLLLICVFRSVREIEEFCSRTKSTKYFNVVDVLKCEGFVPSP